MKKKLILFICILALALLGVEYVKKEENYSENVVKNQVVQDDVNIEKNKDQEENKEKENNTEKEVKVIESNQAKESTGTKKKDEEKKSNTQPIKGKNTETKDIDTPKPEENQEQVQEEKQLTEEEIVAKYTGQFTALRGEFEGKLGGLIGEAKGEYNALSEDDKSSGKLSLGFKYLKKAKGLEKECDGRFDAVLEEMKKELTLGGFSTDAAVKAKAQYKNEKSERRTSLMKKALGK
ncbi:hypothetical protein [Crassaminicella profunda]|uniref:hypothetical protein n=1 Tax=Crassaminicella profunda TaxID=1286698 RepID=UPI001CA607E7|nr:hypothetical protein [Crassaminicella profunda]QZY55348.1 hypothetical protein K7H06_20520 [Crassaminicella profunda]